MKAIGVVSACLYAIAATVLSSSATGDAASPAPVAGPTTISVECAKDSAKSSVSEPNTIVAVTCTGESKVELPDANRIFVNADCTVKGELSSVCPGATVKPVDNNRSSGASKKMNVFFPQLPTSAQAVCLKCQLNEHECTIVIDVAAARPQGPQACAIAGSSVTLQIKEAGTSAQFGCGTGLTLMPTGATKAYADNCTNEETVEGMTRTPGPGTYVTLRADKPKSKKLCYLCKQSRVAAKADGEAAPCKIYVEGCRSLQRPSIFRWRQCNAASVKACRRFFAEL